MNGLDLFMPGRLCLFGEHSDWAGAQRDVHGTLRPGYCLAAGTTQGISARVARDDDRLMVDARAVDAACAPLDVPLGEAAAVARRATFYAYCAGVAAYMRAHFRVGGIRIRTTSMNLPLRKGLSSSAAISVLSARAFNQLYDLGLGVADEMECAYRGEILTGSQCGRLDQVCAYGRQPVFLTFDGERMEALPLEPRAPLHLVIVDLQHSKDTRRILRDLNAAFASRSEQGAQVRDALGPQNERIVSQAREAIEAGNARRTGQLMTEAQAIFDRQVATACPDELTAPVLHSVLAHPLVRELCWGGKGVGSQGDGCAQLVARDGAAQRHLVRELPRLLDVRCLELNITAREGVAA